MTYIGLRLPRKDDLRLTTGGGRYVSDLTAPGVLYLGIVRSSHAHARITSLDLEAAARLPGVVGVFGPDDVAPIMRQLSGFPGDPRVEDLTPLPLARDVVRFVGEPVAAVLAVDRYHAEDAVEAVRVGYEPLPVVVDALDPDRQGAFLFPARGTNRVAVVGYTTGAGEAALADADVVVRTRLVLRRVVAHAMEPRAVLVRYDETRDELLMYASTQSVHRLRDALATLLGRPPASVRVVAPDVGGGFGVKNRLYPEDALAAYLAMRTGRPVKWVGDRREEFLSTNQERDQVHEAALGVRRDGTIVALVDHFVQDNGAYCMAGLVVPETTCVSLPGPYRVPNIAVEGVVVLTNKVPVSPYRGAGRPQGTFVMERLLDLAADALGQSRVAIRDANLLRPQDLPYRSGVRYRDVPLEIREGDFPAIMHAALDHLELQDLAREKADLARQGRLLGLGLANYLEISSGLGFEGAKVRLAEDGMIEIASGSASQGQGHPTMLAQIAADRLGVEMERIRVIEGDTGAIARGIGTFGSRTTVMAGNAVSAAARVFREKLLAEAAERLEASPADLVLRDGAVYVEGVPARALLLSTLAADEALRDRLTVEHYYQTEEPALGMGTHAVLVEIDRETLALRLRRYVIVHDAGVVVNPLSADGQTIGAAVQGLGTTLYEELHLDESGQPLNTSFMDYLLPGAVEMPDFEIHEREFPATSNPEGFKGLAEGGIMPPMAAVLSAVEDALAIPGLHLEEIPVTPAKLHALLSRLGVRP